MFPIGKVKKDNNLLKFHPNELDIGYAKFKFLVGYSGEGRVPGSTRPGYTRALKRPGLARVPYEQIFFGEVYETSQHIFPRIPVEDLYS